MPSVGQPRGDLQHRKAHQERIQSNWACWLYWYRNLFLILLMHYSVYYLLAYTCADFFYSSLFTKSLTLFLLVQGWCWTQRNGQDLLRFYPFATTPLLQQAPQHPLPHLPSKPLLFHLPPKPLLILLPQPPSSLFPLQLSGLLHLQSPLRKARDGAHCFWRWEEHDGSSCLQETQGRDSSHLPFLFNWASCLVQG